jgi:hypothetical protein
LNVTVLADLLGLQKECTHFRTDVAKKKDGMGSKFYYLLAVVPTIQKCQNI